MSNLDYQQSIKNMLKKCLSVAAIVLLAIFILMWLDIYYINSQADFGLIIDEALASTASPAR